MNSGRSKFDSVHRVIVARVVLHRQLSFDHHLSIDQEYLGGKEGRRLHFYIYHVYCEVFELQIHTETLVVLV